MRKHFFAIMITLVFAMNANATTWGPAKHKCPICDKTSTYQEIMSYGGYIYQWPSKFQYIFWPLTDNPSVYCCPNCFFSTYMWDFDSIPDIKLDTIKAFLQTVEHQTFKDYRDIPMTTRLGIAEKIYQILGRDTEFWCKFYRVKGYHYSLSKMENQALESRTKALVLARNMLSDSTYVGREKEQFFIIAAMFNFTNHQDSALVYLNKASSCKYQNKNIPEENSTNLDEYLGDIINQYKEIIEKGKSIEE